jgi:hypothetical protein
MSQKTTYDRRRFLSNALMTLGAAELAMLGIANGQSHTKQSTSRPQTSGSFGALKQIDAGVLNVGYGSRQWQACHPAAWMAL